MRHGDQAPNTERSDTREQKEREEEEEEEGGKEVKEHERRWLTYSFSVFSQRVAAFGTMKSKIQTVIR